MHQIKYETHLWWVSVSCSPSHPTTLSASPTPLLVGQLTRLPFHSGYATVLGYRQSLKGNCIVQLPMGPACGQLHAFKHPNTQAKTSRRTPMPARVTPKKYDVMRPRLTSYDLTNKTQTKRQVFNIPAQII